jgi:hypothetical protein
VMGEKQKNKTRKITIRLAPAEFVQIEKKCKSSTCRKLSEYVRLVLLSRPVTVITRDQSRDEMMLEVTKLRTELNHIGNNFNQATRRLHSLSQINEFRSHLHQQEEQNTTLIQRIKEVNSIINKLADQWLQ